MITVTNWDKFQHYKKPKPPWIKMYRDILNDYTFSSLSLEQRYTLFGLWLLAAETDNQIPDDPKWIQLRLGLKRPPDLQVLRDSHFVTWSSESLDKLYTQTETEERQRREEKRREEGGENTNLKVYGQFENVNLSDSDHESLVTGWGAQGRKYTESGRLWAIEELSAWIHDKKNGKKEPSKSHYATLQRWVYEKYEKEFSAPEVINGIPLGEFAPPDPNRNWQ